MMEQHQSIVTFLLELVRFGPEFGGTCFKFAGSLLSVAKHFEWWENTAR